jgi:AraC-like DNA-binding protein
MVNGLKQPLTVGSLSFIRPDDIHWYENFSNCFQIVNVVIPAPVMTEMFNYLGNGFDAEKLLKSKCSPVFQTSPNEFKDIIKDVELLVLSKRVRPERLESIFRIMLTRIFTHLFPLMLEKGSDTLPDWLRYLTLEMAKKENFVDGLAAMRSISGRSIEHLSRMYKKYLYKSPTEFINELRIEYSAYLITASANKIIEICNEVGFDSLSHFYHLFKKTYGMPPKEFRKVIDKSSFQQLMTKDEELEVAIPKSVTFR